MKVSQLLKAVVGIVAVSSLMIEAVRAEPSEIKPISPRQALHQQMFQAKLTWEMCREVAYRVTPVSIECATPIVRASGFDVSIRYRELQTKVEGLRLNAGGLVYIKQGASEDQLREELKRILSKGVVINYLVNGTEEALESMELQY